MSVGNELPTEPVEPALRRSIPQLTPYCLRTPVLLFLGNEVAPFDDENTRSRSRQGVGQRAASHAATDDDDVEAFDHGRASSMESALA